MTHVGYGLFPSYDLFAFNLEVSVPGTVEIVAMMEAICWPSELQVQSREYFIGSGARKHSLPHRNTPLGQELVNTSEDSWWVFQRIPGVRKPGGNFFLGLLHGQLTA